MDTNKYFYSRPETTETSVPQVWGKNPIFAATKLKEPRSVALSDGTIWTMGTQPPFGQITNPEYLRGFDIRHAEVIFRLISFYRENEIDFSHRVDLSFYKLIEIIGWTRCASSMELLKNVLADLSNIWTEIEHEDGESFKFRILSASVDSNKNEKNSDHLRYVTFDQTFLEFLSNVEYFFSIRLDVFEKIKGKIGKAAYLYLPSRALKNTKKSPFRITLTTFFNQIGVKAPAYKSQRFQKVTGQANMVEQLNDSLISFSQKLRVTLQETKDKKEYNLCAWTEEITDADYTVPDKNSLRTWYINGSYRQEKDDFRKLIAFPPELDEYEYNALEIIGVNFQASMQFLQQAKALLGPFAFKEICGSVKDKKLNGFKVGNWTAYFISMVKSELLGELPFGY